MGAKSRGGNGNTHFMNKKRGREKYQAQCSFLGNDHQESIKMRFHNTKLSIK